MSAEDRFERKRIFFRKICFPCFSDLDQTFPGFLAKVFGRVAELPLKEPRGTFWEQCFFEKNLFQTLRQKLSEKGKFFRLRSLNCIKKTRKTSSENIPWGLDTYFVLLGLLAKQFRAFVKLLSKSPQDRFEKKNISQTSRFFFLDVLTYSQHFQCFGSKSLVWCVKTTFYVSKEAFFWRRTFFGKTDSFSLHVRTYN